MNRRRIIAAGVGAAVTAGVIVLSLLGPKDDPRQCVGRYADAPCKVVQELGGACDGDRAVVFFELPKARAEKLSQRLQKRGVVWLGHPRRCTGGASLAPTAKPADAGGRPMCIVGHVARDTSERGDWSRMREWQRGACCERSRCRCLTPPCKRVPGIGLAGDEPWRRELERMEAGAP